MILWRIYGNLGKNTGHFGKLYEYGDVHVMGCIGHHVTPALSECHNNAISKLKSIFKIAGHVSRIVKVECSKFI